MPNFMLQSTLPASELLRTNQRDDEHKQNGNTVYRELAIMSYPARLNPFNGTPGHIMIAINSAGIGEEAYGFYPNGIRIEFDEGSLADYTRVSITPITERQYTELKKVTADYLGAQDYNFFTNNCAHFVQVALERAGIGLKIGERSNIPAVVGRNIEARFGIGGVRCIGGAK